MKNLYTFFAQLLVALLPLLYLWATWQGLPQEVPTHYDAQLAADRYEAKEHIGIILLLIAGGSLLTAALLRNLHKIDPKQRTATNAALMHKVAWTMVIFMAAIGMFIVYQTQQHAVGGALPFGGKVLFVLIALFFTTLGNFMHTLKPNYFFGIRTPWTLSDEDNWRLTHRLAAKIWFFGGLLLTLLIVVLPVQYAVYAILACILPMTLLPMGYSFYLFNQKNHLNKG